MKVGLLQGLHSLDTNKGGQVEITALFSLMMLFASMMLNAMFGTPWYGLSLVVLGCLLPFGLIALLLSWWLVPAIDRPKWKHFLFSPVTTCMLLLSDMPKLLNAWRQDRSHRNGQKG